MTWFCCLHLIYLIKKHFFLALILNPLWSNLEYLNKLYLKCHKPVRQLNDVDQAVEVVRSQDKAVPLGHDTPPAEQDVAGKTGLQRSRQVLVEDRVQVVVVRTGIPVNVSRESCVGVINSFRVVIAFPEFDRPHVRRDEDGWPEDGVQRRREYRRNRGLQLSLTLRVMVLHGALL